MNSTDEREASGNHSVHLCRTDFPFNQIVSTMLMKLDVGLAETSSRLYSYIDTVWIVVRYCTVLTAGAHSVLCTPGTVVFGNGN